MAGLGGHPRSKDYINTGLKFHKNILSKMQFYIMNSLKKTSQIFNYSSKRKIPTTEILEGYTYSRCSTVPITAARCRIVSSVEEILIMY